MFLTFALPVLPCIPSWRKQATGECLAAGMVSILHVEEKVLPLFENSPNTALLGTLQLTAI